MPHNDVLGLWYDVLLEYNDVLGTQTTCFWVTTTCPGYRTTRFCSMTTCFGPGTTCIYTTTTCPKQRTTCLELKTTRPTLHRRDTTFQRRVFIQYRCVTRMLKPCHEYTSANKTKITVIKLTLSNAPLEKIYSEVKIMELAEIKHELEKTARRLADFRGSL